MQNPMTARVHVNIPFRMLIETHLDRFLEHRLNPEIGFDAQALDAFSLSRIERVAERLLSAGLSITLHAPFMDISPGSPDPEVREVARRRLHQMVRLIPLFRPWTVVCHTGYDHRRYWHMDDVWLKNSLDMWRGIAAGIRDHGARMMLENVYEESPDHMIGLLEGLAGLGVGFCLDVGHHAVFSTTPIADWIASLGYCLGQLHLHDNRGAQDEHLALGQGTIDFEGLFNLIRTNVKNRPVITLEPHKEGDLWPSLKVLEDLWPW